MFNLFRRKKLNPHWVQGWTSGLQEAAEAQQLGTSYCFIEEELGLSENTWAWYSQWYSGRASAKATCINLEQVVRQSLTAQALVTEPPKATR